MNIQNVISTLNHYRHRGVHAVRTPSGVVFMGTRNITPAERQRLLEIPQSYLDKAIRWQK